MYYNLSGEKIFYKAVTGNDFLVVFLAGITYPNPNYHIMHNISRNYLWDNYVFEYVIKGKGYIETEKEKFAVKAGDAYFLNKLQQHVYYSDKSDPFEKVFVVVKGKFVDSLISAYDITQSVIVLHTDVKDIISHIHSLVDTDSAIPYDEVAVDVLRLIQSMAKPFPEQTPQSTGLAKFVRSYLDKNIGEKITLESVCKDLHISKSHLGRIFKEQYGVSPIKYLMDSKVKYACTLLVNTNYPISTIADHLAFGDVKYMSKCIKAATGLSPLQYRKANARTM